jgi:predicted transcriptional regulator of viral defense system
MVLADTARRRLHERALDQYGYVTSRDAEEIGVPAVELRKVAQRGGLDHVAYGLYRFEDIPRTSKDQFMEAVLRVGTGAYLTRDSVLALHELALVNPRRIRVGTPKRVRPHLPEFVEVVRERLEPRELTIYEGIASATVARALLDCRGLVMGERLTEATREAARLGFLRKGEAARILAELGEAA